jgi:hypothetical protein
MGIARYPATFPDSSFSASQYVDVAGGAYLGILPGFLDHLISTLENIAIQFWIIVQRRDSGDRAHSRGLHHCSSCQGASGANPPCASRIIDKSIEVFALGFMCQTTLYNAINQSLTILGAENSTTHAVAVSAFVCPSDPMSGWPRDLNLGALIRYGVPYPARMAFTSYAGMIGSLPVLAQPLPSSKCVVPPPLIAQCNGVFNDLSPIRLASVTDVLSNTIFLAENATTILQELNALNRATPRGTAGISLVTGAIR